MDRDNKMLTIGGIFFLANTLLLGCDTSTDTDIQKPPQQQSDWESSNTMAQRKAGVITEVKEVSPGEYRIINEYPSTTTGVVVQKLDGSQEIIPQEKVRSLVEGTRSTTGFGLGTVLASGLLGYMMGKNTSVSPLVYANENIYKQRFRNRELIDERKKEEEKQYAGRTGVYRGWTNWWFGRSSHTSKSSSSSGKKTGFFSGFSGGMKSFSG